MLVLSGKQSNFIVLPNLQPACCWELMKSLSVLNFSFRHRKPLGRQRGSYFHHAALAPGPQNSLTVNIQQVSCHQLCIQAISLPGRWLYVSARLYKESGASSLWPRVKSELFVSYVSKVNNVSKWSNHPTNRTQCVPASFSYLIPIYTWHLLLHPLIALYL